MQTTIWPRVGGVILASVLACGALSAQPSAVGPRTTTLRAMYGLKPPSELLAPKTALVLVDFQDEFVHGRLALPGAAPAIRRAVDLVHWAHRSGVLVVFVQNVVSRPGSPLFAPGSKTTAFVQQLQPRAGDFVIQKSMVGAFSKTSLDQELRSRGIDTLIVSGFMTHLAVQSTASDASVLGYHVLVAADATATRSLPGAGGEAGVDAAQLQRAALDAISDRVADVILGQTIMNLPVSR